MSKYLHVESVKERHLERLLAMPNVTSVLVHHKRTGGRATGEMAIRVSVLTKRPRSSLLSEELIPPTIEGVRSDQSLTGDSFPGLHWAGMRGMLRVGSCGFLAILGVSFF